MNNLEEYYAVGIQFHGHTCPAMPMCLRAGFAAMEALGVERAKDKELFVDAVIQKTDASPLVVKPFLRAESRFRSGGLAYQQWNAGFRFWIMSWLSVQAYYTPRDQMYRNSPHLHKDAAGGDILFLPKYGSFRLLNRETGEWHITDRFYRYRNHTQVAYITRFRSLAPYVFEEFRADSDQKRLNMHDIGAGIQIAPSSFLTMQLFYDLESNRRQLPDWRYVRYVGISFAAHL